MTLNLGLYFLIDGTWTDFTSHLSASTNPLTFTHGRPDEASQADPSECAFTLVDPDGRFVEDNPRSDLFGRFGRGTLGRLRWNSGTDNYVSTPGAPSQLVYVPDSAAMDTTTARLRFTVEVEAASGDWEAEPADLYSEVRPLLARWEEDQDYRSWRFYVTRDGYLGVDWTTDGTTITQVRSTVTLGSVGLTGRAKLRAYFDGTNWVFEYDALGGAGFVQLGAAVAGSINVQIVFVPTRIGAQGADGTHPASPFHGKIYRATVESGVGFPNVLFDADFRFAEIAVSPLPDGTVIGGGAAVVDPDTVFVGEVVSTSQAGDKAEATMFTSVKLAGASQRLNPQSAPSGSVFLVSTRNYTGSPDLLAYWPCEDPPGTRNISSIVDGALPMLFGGGYALNTFQADDEWVSSDALPTWTTGDYWTTFGGDDRGIFDEATVAMFARIPGGGFSANVDFLRITAIGGDVIELGLGFETDGDVSLLIRHDGGDTRVGALDLDLPGRAALLVLQIRPLSGTLEWTITSVFEDGDRVVRTGTLASTSLGRLTGLNTVPGRFYTAFTGNDMQGATFGHLQVWNRHRIGAEYPEYIDNLAARFTAYVGEAAGSRIVRRSAESGVPLRIEGHPEDTVRMGYMQRGTLAEQRLAAEKVDMGFLGDAPDSYALMYRTSRQIAASPVLEIDYTSGVFDDPWNPVWDDEGVRNDVTVTRVGGGSANSVLTEGPRSIQDPPLGSRHWAHSEERELYADYQLQAYADWLVSLGTAPGSRMPELAFNLGNTRVESLFGPALRQMRSGSRIRVLNPPNWMHPDPVELVVQQLNWTLYPATNVATVSLTCTPGEPWMMAFAGPEAGADDEFEPHVDAGDAWMVSGIDADDTTLTVASHTPLEFTTDPDDLAGGCLLRLGGSPGLTDETVDLLSVSPFVVDTFTRTVASGWGTPDTGSPWTGFASGGAGSSVSGGLGLLTALGASRDAAVYSSVDGDAWDMEGKLSLSALPTGASLLVALRMNWSPADGDFYQVGLTIGTTGAVTMECALVIGGSVGSPSSSVLPFTLAALTDYTFRVSAKDGDIRGLLYPASLAGATGWQVRADIGLRLPPGRGGVYAFRGAGATNSPNVRFDNITVHSPQVLTVDRGYWGWASAHAAFTPVNLRYPWRVGL